MDHSKTEDKAKQLESQNLQKELRLLLDQIMKSLFGVSSPVLINMLNSLFKEDYEPENTEVIVTNNEFVLEYEDYDVIRGDVFFKLQAQPGRPYQYHIDFQTIYDQDMVIRMFAYGYGKAKEMANLHKCKSKFETTIYMPRQLVIYIEQHQDIKEELRLRIVYPDGDEKVYTVPVMKYWEFETSDLMEQKLYPLLPLQVFKLRRKLKHIKEQKHNSEQMQEILQEVMQTAEEVGKVSVCLYNEKIVTGEDLHKILTALGNLVRYLTSKYGNIEHINEEVEIMLKTLYDPVVEEKGIEKGKEEGLKENIQYLLADLADYSEHKERLADQLKLIKDLSKLKELLKASARVTSVNEFMQHF